MLSQPKSAVHQPPSYLNNSGGTQRELWYELNSAFEKKEIEAFC
jgi:hypothetical protein